MKKAIMQWIRHHFNHAWQDAIEHEEYWKCKHCMRGYDPYE